MKNQDIELIERCGKYYDLVYSPDECGYYLHRHSDNAVSKVYYEKSTLLEQFRADLIEFEDADI
jgi:hypothetical protein